MYTYQDFEKVKDIESEKIKFISDAINKHIISKEYQPDKTAYLYDKQRNTFICDFLKNWYDH